MKRPSTLQLGLLMLCGSLLAGFSCFHTADNTSSGPGRIGFAVGLAALAYAAVALIRLSSVATPAAPPAGTDAAPEAPQPHPTIGQGIALMTCGFLLFFFSCGGALIPIRGSATGPLAPIGIPGMLAGTVFMLWGVVRFVLVLVRASRGRHRQ